MTSLTLSEPSAGYGRRPGRRLMDGTLFQQMSAPLLLIGSLGVGASVLSASALLHSTASLGRLDADADEQVRTLQEVERDLADIRTISLKHLASESPRTMAQGAREIATVRQRIRTDTPAI